MERNLLTKRMVKVLVGFVVLVVVGGLGLLVMSKYDAITIPD